MNKIIRIKTINLSPILKDDIKNIIDRLEKDNFSSVSNNAAIRLFPRFIPKEYRINKTIICKSGTIFLSPKYCIERTGDFSFRIRKNDQS